MLKWDDETKLFKTLQKISIKRLFIIPLTEKRNALHYNKRVLDKG